jgi:hypothetical protein
MYAPKGSVLLRDIWFIKYAIPVLVLLTKLIRWANSRWFLETASTFKEKPPVFTAAVREKAP